MPPTCNFKSFGYNWYIDCFSHHSDTVIDCLPEAACPCFGQNEISVHIHPFYRHQVHEIPKPKVNITKYRLFSGQCQHCYEFVRAKKPDSISQGIMGPNLLSYIAVLVRQYHRSIRKIRPLLQEQLGTTFSVGVISEAQTKVASMLTPLHQVIRDSIQKSPLVHIDETSHSRNGEKRLRLGYQAYL